MCWVGSCGLRVLCLLGESGLRTQGLHRCRPSHLEHAGPTLVSDEGGQEKKLTPLVVMGSERGTREWNSPWLLTASGFLLADMLLGLN